MKKWSVLLVTLFFTGMIFWSCTTERDNQAPTCSITYPTDSARYSIGINIDIQVDTNEENSDILEVIFFVDDTQVGNDQTYPYSLDISTNEFTEGFHTIKAVVKNTIGQEAENEIDINLTTANFLEELYYGGLMSMSQNFLVYLNQSAWIDAHQIWNLDYFSNRDNWMYEEIDSLAVVDMLTLSSRTDDVGTPEIEGWNGVRITLVDWNIFHHNLPIEKNQQYYEMIDKYHQFSCGWSDFDGYERNPSDEIIYVTDLVINGVDTVEVVRPKLKLNESNVFDYFEYGY